MKLKIITIVRDGMPYIAQHLDQFKKLSFPWEWVIVEGTAANVNCTAWCRKIEPASSTDGTPEYLQSIESKNIRVISNPWWAGGKIEMFQTGMKSMSNDPGILLQVDSDEMWSAETLELLMKFFKRKPEVGIARFYCRYFVGPDIITVGENCYGNFRGHEWTRAWRWVPGITFKSHEPPRLTKYLGSIAERELTRSCGLMFKHFAYATEAQVRFKETFYNYPGAVEQWRRLQENKTWPTKLKRFLPWVDDAAVATRIDLSSVWPDKTKHLLRSNRI
jgi:hypothetical protein